jgi:glycosyltransferase involved in cell wall biosynthesis
MGEAEPILTIGVPVYNGERYLGQALAGIRAQTFTDFQVLIADNASTDGTAEIAQEAVASDPRFHYLRRESNVGLVPNWNGLFTDTQGEYFAWHSADDVATPGFYDACLKLLRSRPDAAAACTQIELISSDGTSLGVSPERTRSDHEDRAVRFADMASFHHYCQFFYGVFRRTSLARTRLMLPHFWSSDRLMLAELALQGPLVRDPRHLYYVREHDDRVTNAGRTNFYAGMSSPRRGTTLRYARELGRAIDHAQLDPAEQIRVRRALRGWAMHNTHRLARSAAGAVVGAGIRAVTRSARASR